MDDAVLAELEGLRARAYGPDADIGSDPSAVTRLRELEAAARSATIPDRGAVALSPAASARAAASEPASAPVTISGGVSSGRAVLNDAVLNDAAPGQTAPGQTVPVQAAAGRDRFAPVPVRPPLPSQTAAEAAAAPPRTVAQDAPAPGTRPWWRRTAVLWPASVVAAVVIACAVASGVLRPAGSGPREAATLHLSTDVVAAKDILTTMGLGGMSEGVELPGAEFHGLTLFRAEGAMFGAGPTQECLFVMPTDAIGSSSDGFSGPTHQGCSIGPFPATAQFAVDESFPEALRAVYPDGTALQFLLDGDQVQVRAGTTEARTAVPCPTCSGTSE